MNLSHDEPCPGIGIVFTAIISYSHISLQLHLLFVRGERCQIIGPPGYARGEEGYLYGHLTGDLGINVPQSQVLYPGRISQVKNINLIHLT